MACHLDEISLDIARCVFKLRHNKNCPFLAQSQNADFKRFSTTVHILMVILLLVRGGSVLNRHTRNRYWSKIDSCVGAKSQILSSGAPPRKKNLVTIFSQGHVLGLWKPMFY